MYYKIIHDPEILYKFIHWLPETNDTDVYFVNLLCRKKYGPLPDFSIKKFICKKDELFEKIKQLEKPIGCYTMKEGIISQEQLALYINPNSRCLKRTAKILYNTIQDRIFSNSNFHLLERDFYSSVQNEKARNKNFTHFDIDLSKEDPMKYFDFFHNLHTFINLDACILINTKNGVHLLIDNKKIAQKYKNSYYNKIMSYVDVAKDQLMPIPGTIQGDYVPSINFLGND